ncbi:unnamed protein product [Orchesella dallaii]|uniref:Uncharacterized protein n=1 Tax=Orchesella dallaii TaxID=48710 RepID=A0ABP1Q8V6_9HEXA
MAEDNDTITESHKIYWNLMTQGLEKNDVSTSTQFMALHEQAKEQAFRILQEQSPSESDIESSLERLDLNIKDSFEELKGSTSTSSSLKSDKDDEIKSEEKNEEELAAEEISIGIDLGTTYCCVAAYHKGKVIIIPNQKVDGSVTTPSYVCFKQDGTISVGKPAKQNAFKHAATTVYDAKRIIGRRMDDPVLEMDMHYWPFSVVEHQGVPKIDIRGRLYHPEEISAKLLREMRDVAERYFKLKEGSIKKAVITVPAYFTDGQRQATVDAGALAGLEVLTILNEPTAAAIAYSFERLDHSAKKVLVFDMGGGTFDVAIVEMKQDEIEVLGVDGDTHLGGEDFDKNIMKYCAHVFESEKGINLFEGKDSPDRTKQELVKRTLRRLQTVCEMQKKDLSACRATEVILDALVNGEDISVEIRRAKFEELNEKLFEKAIAIVDRALKSVGMPKEAIDDIVLVGGSSRIPKVQRLLTDYFNGKQLNVSINMDEAVAYGAAVQAAMLTGKVDQQFKLKIQDVTPMSLGIEVGSKRFDVIIPKNTRLPAKVTKDYVTSVDFQPEVSINIYEGERAVVENNRLLGHFVLKGIPPKEAGQEVMGVTMRINTMGILQVEAMSKTTRSKNSIVVTENKSRMSKETINNLLLEENW